ncbi:MAG: hypothetical protein KAJ34_05980 [Thermodesulfovibrionia bacterium]|nr:hypothetical protein [Thermodesulfovibrionia bacterium]
MLYILFLSLITAFLAIAIVRSSTNNLPREICFYDGLPITQFANNAYRAGNLQINANGSVKWHTAFIPEPISADLFLAGAVLSVRRALRRKKVRKKYIKDNYKGVTK